MRQYFKDYKAKMAKDEEIVKEQAKLNFDPDKDAERSKGLFVKKKVSSASEAEAKVFLFNFKNPSDEDLNEVTLKVNKVILS